MIVAYGAKNRETIGPEFDPAIPRALLGRRRSADAEAVYPSIDYGRPCSAVGRGKEEGINSIRKFERYVIVGSRLLTGMAVFGSLAGAVLMFFLGLYEIYGAYAHGLSIPLNDEQGIAHGAYSVISVIEGLDRFLIAIVLLYFAFGVYSLFIHPEREPEKAEKTVSWPKWLRVEQIGQLKQVVAEVIIVILLVLFLRVALQAFQSAETPLSWQQIATFVSLPLCTMLLAIALRLVELHPKPPRQSEMPDTIIAESRDSCKEPGRDESG